MLHKGRTANLTLASSEMSAVFKSTFKDIQTLDDNDARELVVGLCKAELRQNGRSPLLLAPRIKDKVYTPFVAHA